ncbi:hypothetical protein, partial [Salmonella sp. s57610]|uniref:hypothetical protein n=1 Tax=Salmonella sp. s57610 TaxID=3159697 RepID=UPI0039808755
MSPLVVQIYKAIQKCGSTEFSLSMANPGHVLEARVSVSTTECFLTISAFASVKTKKQKKKS